jgi:diacylglycerol kinase (ATP)
MSADRGILTGRVKPTGLTRILNAFGYSFRGLVGAWRAEEAFRQEVLFALVAIPLGVWVGDNGIERALLVGPVILILVVELLNSAVEAAIDRIGEERHELSGLAKDLGSAAVFASFVLLGVNWLFVLLG